jgi:hypothetical protein
MHGHLVIINIFITFNDNSYAALICLALYVLGLVIYYICAKKKKTDLSIT